jgi:uncharacterized protein YkwD
MSVCVTTVAVLSLLGTVASPVSAATPNPKDIINNNDRNSVVNAYLNILKPELDVPTGWTGQAIGCVAGTTSAANKKAGLAAINYMRAMADLSPVTVNARLSKQAQASSLIIEANGKLTHTPSRYSLCYTQEGYAGANNGNIGILLGTGEPEAKAATTGARGVTAYIDDPGASNVSVGHRRWLLYSRLAQVGLGDTHNASTIVVMGGPQAPAIKQWVTWPTAGFFPRELQPNGRWSISYPGAAFQNATVTVSTPDGNIAVKKYPVRNGYGDNTLSWDMRLPDKYYDSTADYPVTVTVKGIKIGSKNATKTYKVIIVDADPTVGN